MASEKAVSKGWTIVSRSPRTLYSYTSNLEKCKGHKRFCIKYQPM